MASLDQILDRMTERRAERLMLRVGEIPVVRAAGRDVPVQKVPLAEAQVVALVRELAGPQDADRIDRRESTAFAYRGFDVQVMFAPTGASVDVIPADPWALSDDAAAVPSLETPGNPLPSMGEAPDHRGGLAFEFGDDSPSAIDLDTSGPPVRPSNRPAAMGSSAPSPAMVGVRLPSLAPGVRGPAPAESTVALPGGVLDDMRSWVSTRQSRYIALGALGVLGVVVLGGFLWCNRAVQVPNVVMADASGHPVSFSDMRGAQERMLVVFLLPGCSMSRFAADSLKEVYPTRSERMAFVGLFFGSQSEAERFAKDEQIPFPIYGLKDNKDPFKVQELMKRVGTSDWLVNGIYGGTTIVLDDRNRVIFKLEKEQVRSLPEKLRALPD